MKIFVKKTGIIKFDKYIIKCFLGKKGITFNKKEGDLKTPKGIFFLRYVMYRPDRIKKPKTNLPVYVIKKIIFVVIIPKTLITIKYLKQKI